MTHMTKTLVGEKEVVDSGAIIMDCITGLQERTDDKDEVASRNRAIIENIERRNALLLELWVPVSDSKSRGIQPLY